jgi:hypothetical protein
LLQERLSLRLVQGLVRVRVLVMLRTWVQVRIHIFVLLTGITPFEAGLAVLAVPVVWSSFNLKLHRAKIYESTDM